MPERYSPSPCPGGNKIYPERSGKDFSAVLSFFFCVPKRRNKKKAPQPVLALRASLTSRRGRDAEKLGLRPQTVGVFAYLPRLFRPRLRGAAGQMGEGKIPLARSRAPERLPKRGFALSEALAEFAKPRHIEEYPMRGINSGHPAFGGTRDTGGLFFGSVSLGKQRNEQTDFILPPAEHQLLLTQINIHSFPPHHCLPRPIPHPTNKDILIHRHPFTPSHKKIFHAISVG